MKSMLKTFLAAAVLLPVLFLSASIAAEWTQIEVATTDHLRDIWIGSAADVYVAGGHETTILYYDGMRWTDLENQLPGLATADTWGIWGTSTTNILTVGGWSYYGLSRGSILRFNGSTWQSLTAAPNSFLAWTNELRSIWGTAENDIFAVGERNYVLTQLNWIGPVLHYDGTRVYEMENPRELTSGSDLYDVWGTGPDSVYAVGRVLDDVCTAERCFWRVVCICSETESYNYTNVMHYDGTGWTLHETGVNADLHGVWGTADDDVFAVGQGGVILHYACS